MSQENVQVVRRIYDTWTQDSPTLYDLFDEQVELRLNVVMGPYLGRRGVRQFVADLMRVGDSRLGFGDYRPEKSGPFGKFAVKSMAVERT